MKAIILAAGKGLRMRPLTADTPKPLLKIGGKSILEHIVSRLPPEITELILVVGYLGQKIVGHCGKKFFGRKVRYVWQKQKLGTHHALKLCRHLIEPTERFLVLFADDIHGEGGIAACIRHDGCAMVVGETTEPWKFGMVKLDTDMNILDIVEKPEKDPPSNLASTGVFTLDHRIFDYEAERHPNGEYYLASAISKMLADGNKIRAVRSTLWIPIGYPEDIEKAAKILYTIGAVKKDIHPIYYPKARVTCACGNTFTVGATKEKIEVEICSACHPFYTGKEKLVDTAGRVEKFKARADKAKQKRKET